MEIIKISTGHEFINETYNKCLRGNTKALIDFINSEQCTKQLVNYCSPDGRTALYVAVSCNKLDIVEALIKKEANVNMISDSLSPLMIALLHSPPTEFGKEQNKEIINLLIDVGSNIYPIGGLSPFSLACLAKKNDAMKKLLYKDINIDFIDKHGKKAIDYLYEKDNKEGLDILNKYLLKKDMDKDLPKKEEHSKRLKI